MMKNVVIFNLGNRDLYFKEPTEVLGETFTDIIKNKSRFREMSQYISDNYQDYKNKIMFPIVEKTLQRISKRKKEKIHEIILFASDQDIPHSTDTIHVAKVLQAYLLDLKQSPQFKQLLDGLKKPIVRLTKQNPADLDVMNDFYETEIGRVAGNLGSTDQAYVSITSGTPAMSTMLLLNGIKHLKNRVEILYLLNNSNLPIQLQIGKILMKQNYIDIIRENIENYDYYAALKMIQNHSEEFGVKDVVKSIEQLLRYAHARASFDFDKAEESIQQVWDNSSQYRGVIEELYDQIYDLKDSEESNANRMMSELYWNMWMLYQRGQFIDMVGRVFRFHEESLKLIIKDRLGIPLREKGKYVNESWLKGQESLLNSLKNYKGKQVQLDHPLTRFSMEAIVKFYIKQGNPELQVFLDTSNALDKLATLRNKLVLAHGWKGCSEQAIYNHVYDELKIKDISELEDAFFGMLRTQLSVIFNNNELGMRNIYQEINKVLLQFISDLR